MRRPLLGKEDHAESAAARVGNNAPMSAVPPATENSRATPVSSTEPVKPSVRASVAATVVERASDTEKVNTRGLPGAHATPVGQDSRRVTCGRGCTSTLPIPVFA